LPKVSVAFLEVPEFDMERLLVAWRDAVFALYLSEEKIDPEVVENMRSWQHSGFSVDQSVLLPAGGVSASRRCFCQPAMFLPAGDVSASRRWGGYRASDSVHDALPF